jgi:hypothetical protein
MTDPDIADQDTLPDQDTLFDPDEKDIEAPDADALDQRIPADPKEAAQQRPPEPSRRLEVNDWDALEQAKVVDLDDDY